MTYQQLLEREIGRVSSPKILIKTSIFSGRLTVGGADLISPSLGPLHISWLTERMTSAWAPKASKPYIL